MKDTVAFVGGDNEIGYMVEKKGEYGIYDNGHILVIDDNAMVLRNIKSLLENRYSVAVAPSGKHGFMSIEQKKPNLILLDYEMPGMNGKEVLEKLQEDEDTKDIPVVFLTSVDSRDVVMELLALKPAGYLLKPVDIQMLHDKIFDIIGR